MRNGDLADIVEQSAQLQMSQVASRQAPSPAQAGGIGRHALGMLDGLVALEAQNVENFLDLLGTMAVTVPCSQELSQRPAQGVLLRLNARLKMPGDELEDLIGLGQPRNRAIQYG